jgi:hypothetical protein
MSTRNDMRANVEMAEVIRRFRDPVREPRIAR